MKNAQIEAVLAVFSDYIASNPSIDVVYSEKFGYLLVFQESYIGKFEFQTDFIEDGATLCKRILDYMEIDFASERGFGYWYVSREYYTEFRKAIQMYMTQLPKYEYLLEKYQ